LLRDNSDLYFTHLLRTGLDLSIVSRKLVGSSVLILLSVGLAAAFLMLWPRSVSLILAGTSLLCDFGALLFLCRAARWEYALQVQRVILLASGCFGLAFAGLAWKYHHSARAFSSASLIALAMLCFGALAAFLILRSSEERKRVSSPD